MKENNKSFFDIEKFTKQIEKLMATQGITLDELHQRLTKINYEITRNNLSLYLKRLPNVNFLKALCIALNVSSDYLLGLDAVADDNTGINYQYDSPKYSKYEGRFNLYYYPTKENSDHDLIKAEVTITRGSYYSVEMVIPTSMENAKYYTGRMQISDTYNVCYISLQGDGFGEVVNMMFCDPALNQKDPQFRLGVGLMLSVSSGDLKRSPVVCRFILSREGNNDNAKNLKAHLKLNTKYIEIRPLQLKKALDDTFETSPELRNAIMERIETAFLKREYFCLEESFLANTIANDFELDEKTSAELLINLRLRSLSEFNTKINRFLDSHIYEYQECLIADPDAEKTDEDE